MTDNLISKRSATERLIIAKTLLESVLQDMPAAEPEPSQVARDIATIIENEQDMRVILSHPKKGKWIDYCGGVKCDQCGFECDDTYYLGEANYCPNCGARMEGE